MRRVILALAASILLASGAVLADEPVFSGPQPGERLAPFTIRGVFDDDAGKPIDLVARAGKGPLLLVFVHEANRPSVAMIRVLMNYASRRAADGLVAGVAWLADDATAAEQFLRRARHALPAGVPIGISTDGAEGPGAYGLNRHVTLTVLVARDGVVAANFALVQPSVQSDAPKVLAEVVKLIGGKVPPVEELAGTRPAAAPGDGDRAEADDPVLAEKLRAVIRKGVGREEVDGAAAAVEAYVAERRPAQVRLGRIARRIVDSGRLADYGTPRAQEHLRTWAERFGAATRGRDEGGVGRAKDGDGR